MGFRQQWKFLISCLIFIVIYHLLSNLDTIQHIKSITNTYTIQLPKRNVIISIACGYDLQSFKRFILPLRQYYNEDIVLFINNNTSNNITNLCHLYNVKTITVTYKNYEELVTKRFMDYVEVCNNYNGLCLITDFRDVFFQANPFKNKYISFDYDVILFEEEGTIGNCPLNTKWIRRCFGHCSVDNIYNKKIICAGTIIASNYGLKIFVDIFNEHLYTYNNVSKLCNDQGIVNYIYYNNILKEKGGINVVSQKRGEGIVNTIYYVRDIIDQYINVEKTKLLNNDNITVSPIVHQYDRRNSLRKILIDLLKSIDK